MTAGQAFVKKIGPFGSILFLIIFIAFLIICFTPPKNTEETEPSPSPEAYSSEVFSADEGAGL